MDDEDQYEFYLVWRPDTRPPVVVHDIREDAVEEAKRIARGVRGSRIYILKAVEFVESEEVPIRHEYLKYRGAEKAQEGQDLDRGYSIEESRSSPYRERYRP